jgi:OFA family oxalate/formate antiporter-like MFS transporter
MANTDQKVLNRWLVVVGAILIQLCLGAIYAWSAFTGKLCDLNGDYCFTAKQTQAIFSAGLAAFAIVMAFIGGPWQKKSGPRIVAVTGGIILGIGYILGGLLGKSFLMQFICIGLIGGAGIGLAYVVPIACGAKWFPDKKGLIMGLAVAGFGFGATIWVKLADSWGGGLLNTAHIASLPGVQSVFVIYGIIFMVLVLIGSIWMVNPPDGYLPKGYTPPVPKPGAADAKGSIEFSVKEMWSTPQFYMLWLTFIFSAGTGLMVIGVIKLFGIDALQVSKSLDAAAAGAIAGTAMAWYAIFNGLGRIIWGTVSDKIGRKISIFAMCVFQGIIMLAFFKLGQSEVGLIVGACIIGFNFGGNFALFPAATADFFGNKSVGMNYGWMFTAYGIGGIAMPLVAGYFKDAAALLAKGAPSLTMQTVTQAWTPPFLIGGVICILAALISLMAKPPQKSVKA